jgi:hypothetical protein
MLSRKWEVSMNLHAPIKTAEFVDMPQVQMVRVNKQILLSSIAKYLAK